MVSEGHHHGTGFAHVEILLAMQATVFSRRDVKRDGIFSLQHDSIGPGIDPALFGILRNDEIVRADVASAVELVPAGNGKLFEIDVSLDTVLENRRIVYIVRFDRFKTADLLSPFLNEFC